MEGLSITPATMLLQPISLLILHLLVLRVSSAPTNCTSLTSLTLPDVTITDAYQLDAGTTFSTSVDPTCFQPTYSNSVAICRVLGEVTTSPTSSVKFEMWLPDTWYRRVLTVGNGGLAGCKLFSSCICRSCGWSKFRLITYLFFHSQASNTRTSTMVPLSTSLRSPRMVGTMEPSTPAPFSCPLALNHSPIFLIARCMWLRFWENRSPRSTTALRTVIRTTTGVLREGDKEFPSPLGIPTTLTVSLLGLLLSISITSLALPGSGPLT